MTDSQMKVTAQNIFVSPARHRDKEKEPLHTDVKKNVGPHKRSVAGDKLMLMWMSE
jgi:hypothetical protein